MIYVSVMLLTSCLKNWVLLASLHKQLLLKSQMCYKTEMVSANPLTDTNDIIMYGKFIIS